MTAANFPAWFAFMERRDIDGQPLHDTPKDPGGDTAFGWTFATWEGFAKLHGLDPSLTHFQSMQQSDFELPSRLAFWNAVKGDQLPAGVDVIWCDFQFGSFYATEVLQGVVGTEQDNSVGPQTINATWMANDKAGLLDRMTAARKSYYATLPTYADFGNGWNRRADDCLIVARQVCGLSAAPPPSPAPPPPAPDSADALNAAELNQIEQGETTT